MNSINIHEVLSFHLGRISFDETGKGNGYFNIVLSQEGSYTGTKTSTTVSIFCHDLSTVLRQMQQALEFDIDHEKAQQTR
tara:strand:+ start:1160 stop:1399 length:240 start_codon:yes stop_codon:yes gene_type:complete